MDEPMASIMRSASESSCLQLMQKVADFLEKTGIAYRVVSSFASMAYGEPRFTNDIDILADVRPEHIESFLAAFPARRALAARASRTQLSLGP